MRLLSIDSPLNSSVVFACISIACLLVMGPACKSGSSDKQAEPPSESEMKDQKGEATPKSGHQVTLYNYQFNPNKITIDQGDTITFANKDPEAHTVRIAALDIKKSLGAGESWEHTFETVGDFAVENPDIEKSMKMTIMVTKPDSESGPDA